MDGQSEDPLVVLVADGDASFAEAACDALAAAGEPVVPEAVESAGAAVERVDEGGPDVDGVVVGGGLGSPAGAVERLSGADGPPVVVVADDEEVVSAAADAGADGYYPRTTAPAQYEAIVERFAAAGVEGRDGESGRSDRSSDGPAQDGRSDGLDSAYREVFENVGDGLVLHDAETGEILDVNERFCEMNGYGRSELVGETIDVVIPEEEGYGYEAAQELIQRAREEGPELFEWRNRRADGETFPVEVHLAVVQLFGDERVLASVRDVTERKRREREYEQIFDGVRDAIAVFDPETLEILDANEAYLDLVGYQDLEAVREQGVAGLSATAEGFTVEEGRAVHHRVAETGEPEVVEWAGETADGERRSLEVKVAPAVIGGEAVTVAVHRDVTGRVRRERAVRALQDATERMQDADTAAAVAEAAVDAVQEALDLPAAACWWHDPDGERLEPAAATDAARETGLAEPPADDRPEFDAFREGEVTDYVPAEAAGGIDLEAGLVLPLGDRGLIAAGREERVEYGEVLVGVARTLAEHTTTALDRVERAREVRESERRFRVIADRIDEVITLTTADFSEVLYVNPAYEDVWGRPAEELYEDRTSFLEAIHPEDRAAFEAEWEAMVADIEAGEPADSYEFEYRIRRPDGEVRWLHGRGYPVELADGARYVGITEDVTERRRREREYERIFDGVNDAITVHDPAAERMLEANQGMADLVGRDPEAVVEAGVGGLSVTEAGYTAERAYEIMRRVVETGEPETHEWLLETADGERRWVESSVTPARIGGQQRALIISRDVTRRKAYEDRLAAERDRRSALFENSPDPIMAVEFEDGTPRVEEVNDAFEETFGFDETGLAGRTVAEAVVPEGEREEYEQLRRQTSAGEPVEAEVRRETADGVRDFLLRVLPFDAGEGPQQAYVWYTDVTERKRREEAIRELYRATDALQGAETPAEVGEIAVEATRDVLDLPVTACWLRADAGRAGPRPDGGGAEEDGTPAGTGSGGADANGNGEAPDRLEPVATAETLADYEPAAFEPGDPEYEAVRESETLVYDPSERFPENPLDAAIMLPLGEHGLLGAGAPGVEEYPEFVIDAGRSLAGHVRTALDRVERGRELRESERRFRTIAERMDEIVYLADADLTEVEYVNPAYADVYGRPVEELYEDARAFLEPVHPADRPAFEAAVEAMLADIEAGEPADSYEFSYRIERPDGELRWIEATGYPILREEGSDRYVAVAEDVTERERRERTLETFHEATRELTAADSRDAACRRAVEAAESVLEFPLVSVHLYDEASGTLEPAAATDRLSELDVDIPSFEPGEGLAWEVFVEGEPAADTDRAADAYGSGVSGPDLVLPLGSHGVMLVGAPSSSFDDGAVELAQVLAATLEAALNHVAGERALAERERELRRQQERAERLEQLNAVIRDIEQATVERSSRAGIEEAVCERLVEVEDHEAVWIAEPAVGDDGLVVRTAAGGEDAYLDALSEALDASAGEGASGNAGGGGHPAVAAYREAEPAAVANVATGVADGAWRTTALRHGIQSAVAVPIAYEETVHGVLTVASESPDAFDEPTRDVLAELGRSIGYAVAVTERERALESEGTTELEFAVEDHGLFFVRGAADAGCRVELERTVRRSGGSFSTFYVVEGADPGELVELATAAASVETAQVVSADDEGDGGLIEVSAPTWFGAVFTDHGAVVREAAAEGGDGRLVVEAPRGADIRAVVEGFRERYPASELVAQRQRERTVRSLFELQDALAAGLTERQWEALETAYSAGYFAWPREASGEEVADLLGVTQPTFNKHLRTAERTAFRMLLDREYPDDAD